VVRVFFEIEGVVKGRTDGPILMAVTGSRGGRGKRAGSGVGGLGGRG